jgi:hypothetical protein
MKAQATNLVKNSRLKIEPSEYIDERGKEQNYYILDRKNFSIGKEPIANGFSTKRH